MSADGGTLSTSTAVSVGMTFATETLAAKIPPHDHGVDATDEEAGARLRHRVAPVADAADGWTARLSHDADDGGDVVKEGSEDRRGGGVGDDHAGACGARRDKGGDGCGGARGAGRKGHCAAGRGADPPAGRLPEVVVRDGREAPPRDGGVGHVIDAANVDVAEANVAEGRPPDSGRGGDAPRRVGVG